jgi:hypothetical protein
MIYLDVSIEMKAQAMAKIQDDTVTSMPKKWKQDSSLASFCGVKPIQHRS